MPLQTMAAALVAAAVAVLVAAWSRSPVHLPLPNGARARWLRSVPVLATAAIIGILLTWYTDCRYLKLLTWLVVTSLLLCIILIVVHHVLLERAPGRTTTMILLCFGWSIAGATCVASAAAMLIAKENMDAAYAAKPLTLWRILDGRKQAPGDAIYLTARLPAHFRAELDECHRDTVDLSIEPRLGRLQNGTYFAPDVIPEERQVTVSARSDYYGDIRSATVILLPDLSTITRTSYPIEDDGGNPAVVDLIIISRDHSWVYKDEGHIERNAKLGASNAGAVPVCRSVIELAGSRSFDPYADVIAIGTASREGHQVEEDGRAGRRGAVLASWVNRALRDSNRPKRTYSLNLGQYRRSTGEPDIQRDETARERPVVILGVARTGPINLSRALNDLLARYKNDEFFRFLIDHYPKRDLQSVTQVAAEKCE